MSSTLLNSWLFLWLYIKEQEVQILTILLIDWQRFLMSQHHSSCTNNLSSHSCFDLSSGSFEHKGDDDPWKPIPLQTYHGKKSPLQEAKRFPLLRDEEANEEDNKSTMLNNNIDNKKAHTCLKLWLGENSHDHVWKVDDSVEEERGDEADGRHSVQFWIIGPRCFQLLCKPHDVEKDGR